MLLPVTLKFRSGRQVCRLAQDELGLENWANEDKSSRQTLPFQSNKFKFDRIFESTFIV
jgi:hypothetical protein